MNVLRAPTPADICRKRKVATVSPRGSKSKLSRSNSSPELVTPSQRVKECPSEELKVSAGKIFCAACREEHSTEKSTILTIENHIASAKHSAGKKRLARINSNASVKQALITKGKIICKNELQVGMGL